MTVTLVTGASTGIGLCTALHLARRGHRVFAGLRNRSRGALLEKAALNEGLPIEIVNSTRCFLLKEAQQGFLDWSLKVVV